MAARNTVVQNVIYTVDEAYWLVVSLKSKQLLAASFVNLVDTLLHYDVEAMLDAGVATRSDLLTVDVKLNEAKIMLTKVENGLTLSRMALAQICGQPVSAAMRHSPTRIPAYRAAPEPRPTPTTCRTCAGEAPGPRGGAPGRERA